MTAQIGVEDGDPLSKAVGRGKEVLEGEKRVHGTGSGSGGPFDGLQSNDFCDTFDEAIAAVNQAAAPAAAPGSIPSQSADPLELELSALKGNAEDHLEDQTGHDATGGVRAFSGDDNAFKPKYYQTQYPVSFTASEDEGVKLVMGSLPNDSLDNTRRATNIDMDTNMKNHRVVHVRKNSCGNSSTSQVRNNNSVNFKGIHQKQAAATFESGEYGANPLGQDEKKSHKEQKPAVVGSGHGQGRSGNDDDAHSLDEVDVDAVRDFNDFLDSYYNIPEGMEDVGASVDNRIVEAPEPTLLPSHATFNEDHSATQKRHDRVGGAGGGAGGGTGAEGRRNANVHEVYKGRIQKKVSNPLHGALQAAMAASSSHTLQYDPLQYGGMPPHDQSQFQAAGQDDMCTPQSQLQPSQHHPHQHADVYQAHRLERRHSHHFGSPNNINPQQEVYHGSPIGLAYERAPGYLQRHHSLDRDVIHQHLYDKHPPSAGGNMWRRQSLSGNTNSSGQHTYSRDSLKQLVDHSSDVFKSSTSNTTTTSIGARGPRGSSSRYRGVTQHRRTKRWEAHVWDKGKQVYLGGFESEHRAGRAYDVVVLKTRGADRCQTNFPIQEYSNVIPYLNSVTRDELVLLLRRRSKGFSRGSSKYIGVTKHKCGKWEARISNSNKSMNTVKHKRKDTADSNSKHSGEPEISAEASQQAPPATSTRKYTYLGLYETELEAARVHDKAAVALFGLHAHTNFDVCSYGEELLIHNPGMKEMGMLKLFQGITHELLY